jgi:hypothetical protein
VAATLTPATPPAPNPGTSAPPPPSGEDRRIKVAVLSLKTDDADTEKLGKTVVALTSSHLDTQGVFQVITEDDVRQMVSFDQMKSALSCDAEASCLSEIGEALGVRYLVTGSLGLVGSTHVLTLVLIDSSAARPLKRETASYNSVDELLRGLPRQVERAVSDLLYQEKGRLVVSCSEEGAVVELDGKALGTTPFAEREVPSGPHRVTVSKSDFIQFAVDVTVRPREQTLVTATLQPSPALLAARKAAADRTRLAALGTGVGAAASAVVSAAGIGLFFFRREGFRVDRNVDAAANVEVNGAEYAELAVEFWGGVSAGVVAVGLGAASVYLFASGDDPAQDQQSMGSPR